MWTDDPVFDAERYTAEQEAELDKLPKCADCGHPIQDELICPDCLDSNYRRETDDYGG